MALIGVTYKVSKLAYKAYKGLNRVHKAVKMGDSIYRRIRNMNPNIRYAQPIEMNDNQIQFENKLRLKDSNLNVRNNNNEIQYPINVSMESRVNKKLSRSDILLKGVDLITWLI